MLKSQIYICLYIIFTEKPSMVEPGTRVLGIRERRILDQIQLRVNSLFLTIYRQGQTSYSTDKKMPIHRCEPY